MRPTGIVVLVHGLNRTSWSMSPLAWAARRRGYTVRNWGYRSRGGTIAEHGAALAAMVRKLAETESGPIHIVTHSLGGIVVRAALQHESSDAWRHRLGRIVMLAPPNHGSELADLFAAWPVTRRVLGPAGVALGTGTDSVPHTLGALPDGVEVGVIAGDRTFDPLLGRLVSGPHDGKVSVASTHVEGMTDHRVVHRGHTFLMIAPDVQAAVFAFLEHGRFP